MLMSKIPGRGTIEQLVRYLDKQVQKSYAATVKKKGFLSKLSANSFFLQNDVLLITVASNTTQLSVTTLYAIVFVQD